jgi:hypothetical protein
VTGAANNHQKDRNNRRKAETEPALKEIMMPTIEVNLGQFPSLLF